MGYTHLSKFTFSDNRILSLLVTWVEVEIIEQNEPDSDDKYHMFSLICGYKLVDLRENEWDSGPWTWRNEGKSKNLKFYQTQRGESSSGVLAH